jgi:single-strand DNA-binding protein
MYQNFIAIGNVGNKDAELRFTPSGKQVASFSMAVNKTWTNQEGQRQEKSTWFRITVWDKLALIVGEYVKAGNKVMIVGEIEDPRPWTDKDGKQRASLEITAQVVKFLDSKGQEDTEHPANPKPAQQPTGKQALGNPNAKHVDDDSSIPF